MSRPSGRRPLRPPRDGSANRQNRARDEDSLPALAHRIREDLRQSDPLALLQRASGVLQVAKDREDVLESFLGIDTRESTAMLTAMAAIAGDLPGYELVGPELERRRHDLPRWANPLTLRVGRTAVMGDELGDGENLVIEMTTASGYEFAILVFVDHTSGTALRDALAAPQPFDAVLRRMRRGVEGHPSGFVTDLPPEEAAARIKQALELTDRFYPPLETTTYPLCRPLVDRAVRQLPPGGIGYIATEWTEKDLRNLEKRFLDSVHARLLDEAQVAMTSTLIWLGSSYGSYDPLHWSPAMVGHMLPLVLRKVLVPAEELRGVPGLMRALVQFAHAERGIHEEHTRDTMAEIDHWEPRFQGELEAGALDRYLRSNAFERFLALTESFGDELHRIDTTPLPDEAFDWTGIPEDVRPRVGDVLERVDAFCDARLDVEFRTACRRLIARSAHDAPTFYRHGKVETTAAAVSWVIGTGNGLFTRWAQIPGHLKVKDMLAWFGLTKGVSERGWSLLAHIGVAGAWDLDWVLPFPEMLVSAARANLIEDHQALMRRVAQMPDED